MASKRYRNGAALLVAIALLALFALALRPAPALVDTGTAVVAPLAVSVKEEARTRVRDPYIVSAPVAGRLLRVGIKAGEEVIAGTTVVAQLLPAPPSALDSRTREQAEAAVNAAQAGLAVARADQKKAQADLDLASEQVKRFRTLRAGNAIPKATLDQAEREMSAAAASIDVAEAAIAMRIADVQRAEARLISFGEGPRIQAGGRSLERVIPIVAPVSGSVLRVIQESETTLAAGAPIIELGDVANDLEVVAELLSSDAVRVSVGDVVEISNWGGDALLRGTVERIEPWGFTKFSALGVEEQRVNTIIGFDTDTVQSRNLGHGYRVEVAIVVWQQDAVLQVPTSALFQSAAGWAVYRVIDGRADLTAVRLGKNNGEHAQITDGLSEGDRIILYPSDQLADGAAVQQRSQL